MQSHEFKEKPKKTTLKVFGFGRRLAAMFIDGLFVTFVSMLLLVVIYMLGILWSFIIKAEPKWIDTIFGYLLVLVPLFLVSILYFVAYWVRSGQTFGNSVMGIKVVAADGTPPTTSKAILRYLGYIISAIPFSLGFLWVAVDKKRQGWHDKIAGSFVVDVEEELSADDASALEPSDPSKGWVWLLVYVVLAFAAPWMLFGGLIFLGPFVAHLIANLVGYGS